MINFRKTIIKNYDILAAETFENVIYIVCKINSTTGNKEYYNIYSTENGIDYILLEDGITDGHNILNIFKKVIYSKYHNISLKRMEDIMVTLKIKSNYIALKIPENYPDNIDNILNSKLYNKLFNDFSIDPYCNSISLYPRDPNYSLITINFGDWIVCNNYDPATINILSDKKFKESFDIVTDKD